MGRSCSKSTACPLSTAPMFTIEASRLLPLPRMATTARMILRVIPRTTILMTMPTTVPVTPMVPARHPIRQRQLQLRHLSPILHLVLIPRLMLLLHPLPHPLLLLPRRRKDPLPITSSSMIPCTLFSLSIGQLLPTIHAFVSLL